MVLASGDVDELARLSRTVVVLRERRSAARLRGVEVEPDAILREL